MTPKKKLIEVALPLEAINIASAREKSIRHGHPSTLHLWWARRPLAAARAVIFAQMVDDPSSHPDIFPTEKQQEKERQRLFRIIEDLVKWENTTNETVLQQARDEIWQSWRYTCAENADHPRAAELFDRYKLPAFHDPFAGGGALPLEAQRLGLESYASDLNPVAVLINKAMIEIPPKFAAKPPVNPQSRTGQAHSGSWRGAQGLAEDVRYYGQWMRDEAFKRIGHLYPQIEITPEMLANNAIGTGVTGQNDGQHFRNKGLVGLQAGQKLTVIAWLWARTVKSPNPAFSHVDVPLASTFMLSTKAGKEAYVEPVIEGGSYHFEVRTGTPPASAINGTSAGKRAGFLCLMSGTPLSYSYIRDEGTAGRMGAKLMAIVAEGAHGRVYLAPTSAMESVAQTAQPTWKPDTPMYGKCRVNVSNYGFDVYGDLFTSRQLVALTTFSDLVQEARDRVKSDAIAAGLSDDGKALDDGGIGATAYADAVGVYLSFAISKMTNIGSSIASWMSDRGAFRETFARQAIPMTWDFAEANTFADIGGSFSMAIEKGTMALDACPATSFSISSQHDASLQAISLDKVVSTDPPYYDNIGYADLSDFFYVWLRRSLKPVFPDLFGTLAVPKAEELVATPYRHGSREKAEKFFLDGMTNAMHRLAEQAHPAFPVTIYYAFKQSESGSDDGTTNTGWDTFLAAVIEAGFAISGTWPVRTEGPGRMIAMGTNALASSIVLVCRKRPSNAPTATRREFVTALKAELPQAMVHLQAGNIAPVDLAQAAIGPGMAVYTRYAKVLDAEGKPLSVRTALALINQTLDEALAEQEGDFDADSRWALTWFDQMGFNDGDYGVAEQLSKSKNTSVGGMVEAGIVLSKAGKVRLLKPSELPANWNPNTDTRLTVWETVHQLIRVLESGGEAAAATLVAQLGNQSETARELCYRLYTLCERKKRATEAMAYNGLVQSWPEITRLARESQTAGVIHPGTTDLFGEVD
jgi:putative DNA methylase